MERRCAFVHCQKIFSVGRKDKEYCSRRCKKNSYYWKDREQILKARAENKPKKYCIACKQNLIPRICKYCSQCRIIKNKEWKHKEYKNHLQRYRRQSRINQMRYIYSSPERMARTLLRNRFREAVKAYTLSGKIRSSKDYGICYKQIIEKLEKDLGRKLVWEDLNKNHIHHIKELVTFNLEDLNEIPIAFSPENIVLLPREEHRKISKEFLAKWRTTSNSKMTNHRLCL